ncbi:hypothetical protein [Legionella maioricensis]|uniref:Uncharacterized protein n=1 Tax=Legionella maioricensis TaxID=2896528 RepID=A0A9X2D197_9GAMM|nr:hypothetical protein [Legionella maioricensis]MCL9684553.1 hypothetical protein [Legionella maioricensis]MCL9687853.1 hypothetical protein [Legionella maioricensis]
MHMRGERYCEIILSKKITSYAIYNTLGLNDCPPNIWDKVTVAQVKQETGFSFAHLNGPRYWVIDGFNHSNLINSAIKTINGLAMREVGVLDIKWVDLLKSRFPYHQHHVKRQTTWFYEAGKPIYELIDANGEVFVMQSYSIQQSPQTEQSLAQLGTTLKLPKGWIFKTGLLKTAESIEAINNLAIVVQDDLENTYQKAPHDLLKSEEDHA